MDIDVVVDMYRYLQVDSGILISTSKYRCPPSLDNVWESLASLNLDFISMKENFKFNDIHSSETLAK